MGKDFDDFRDRVYLNGIDFRIFGIVAISLTGQIEYSSLEINTF